MSALRALLPENAGASPNSGGALLATPAVFRQRCQIILCRASGRCRQRPWSLAIYSFVFWVQRRRRDIKIAWCPVPEISMTFAAGQLAVFQGASDEHI